MTPHTPSPPCRSRAGDIVGVGARDRGKVAMPVSGECSPAIPTRVGLEPDALSVEAAQPGDPVGDAAALELIQPVATRRRRWRRSPCRTVQMGCRARSQYAYSSRAPATQRRALSEPGGVVDARVDHAGVVSRSGASRGSALALEHAQREAAGDGSDSSRATARPRIPPPTIARRSGGNRSS